MVKVPTYGNKLVLCAHSFAALDPLCGPALRFNATSPPFLGQASPLCTFFLLPWVHFVDLPWGLMQQALHSLLGLVLLFLDSCSQSENQPVQCAHAVACWEYSVFVFTRVEAMVSLGYKNVQCTLTFCCYSTFTISPWSFILCVACGGGLMCMSGLIKLASILYLSVSCSCYVSTAHYSRCTCIPVS